MPIEPYSRKKENVFPVLILNVLKKFFVFLVLILIAIFLGACYGILHDQITYTVSPEYYTKFKFVQFGLADWGFGQNIGTFEDPEILLQKPRVGAAIVGVLATWWFGGILGIILGLVGFIHPTAMRMFKITLKAFLYTTLVALVTGLLGLGYGKLFLTENRPKWYLPENLVDYEAFIAVGSMHNFSYLGGGLGLLVGNGYSLAKRYWRRS